MCGRFTLTATPDQLADAFPQFVVPRQMTPKFNIAPAQPIAVVPNDGSHKVDFFTWGLVPPWAKDPASASRLINARAETLAEKPSFRSAYKRRRCLILADGFFEWQQIPGQRGKQPHYITLASRQPFAFAGLWEQWWNDNGSGIKSATIITTEPNEMMAQLHNRMPVILQPHAYARWLDPGERSPADLRDLLIPYPAAQMAHYPVSNLVNSPFNDMPDTIHPMGANTGQ
jgi:putative SOS response-associated peptidase YedK